ncbi:restriction endonuclease [Bacillus cereus]|uniref:restriction endonuclease n=1 Tax=Bacillus cereus TaxID=1396 RepID=UPI001E458953|nr:restriction endonuclease [Bacillus cereus]MCC2457816.1 restriction endonuclease [Bacillus cereus]
MDGVVISKNWEDKGYSLPNIPREKNYCESLLKILKIIQTYDTNDQKVDISNKKYDINYLCTRLQITGFVEKIGDRWMLTTFSTDFMQNQDQNDLFHYLHSKIKFFGEILFYLKETDMTIGEILDLARTRYSFGWKTKAPVSDRLRWLTDLGCLAFSEFKYLYSITDIGENFLNTLMISDFDFKNRHESDHSTRHPFKIEDISEWIRDISDLDKKIEGLGYLAGSQHNILTTAKTFIKFIGEKKDIHDISNFAFTKYEISNSSVKHYLHTLEKLNLVFRTSFSEYSITEYGKRTLEIEELDFIFYLNKFLLFLLDMLPYMNASRKSINELMAISRSKYNFEKNNKDAIRKRINLLLSANLVTKLDHFHYKTSELGAQIVDLIQKDIEHEEILTSPVAENEKETEDILVELRVASGDSTNPERFEKICAICFEMLGYESKWIGGSGNTDILVQTISSPKFSYRIIIDTKSTSSPSVNESQIDFDTLKEHKVKNNADFVVIVGKSFSSSRLLHRAKEHGVVLIDIESLSDLILSHMKVPLSYESYKNLFLSGGLLDLTKIEEDSNHLIRKNNLIKEILNCLIEQNDDEVTNGILTEREIYFILKNSNSLKANLSLKEIQDTLTFLSSPFINGIRKTKDGYYAMGSLNEISKTFQFYGGISVNS